MPQLDRSPPHMLPATEEAVSDEFLQRIFNLLDETRYFLLAPGLALLKREPALRKSAASAAVIVAEVSRALRARDDEALARLAREVQRPGRGRPSQRVHAARALLTAVLEELERGAERQASSAVIAEQVVTTLLSALDHDHDVVALAELIPERPELMPYDLEGGGVGDPRREPLLDIVKKMLEDAKRGTNTSHRVPGERLVRATLRRLGVDPSVVDSLFAS